MQISTEAVEAGFGTEEPPNRNVRVARRGVAGGLLALVAYLLLAMYAAMSGWAHSEGVAFARAALTVAMIAGMGFALYGYGVARAERNTAAVMTATLDRLEEVLAAAEVNRVRREHRTADRVVEAVGAEVAEHLQRDRTLLRLRPQDPQQVIAKVSHQHRDRRGRVAGPGGRKLSARYTEALERIAKKIADSSNE